MMAVFAIGRARTDIGGLRGGVPRTKAATYGFGCCLLGASMLPPKVEPAGNRAPGTMAAFAIGRASGVRGPSPREIGVSGMTVMRVERVVYGVPNLDECVRFFTDFGLDPLDGGIAARFATQTGQVVELRDADDPSLPPPVQSGPTL